MKDFRQRIKDANDRRAADAQRFAILDLDHCMMCDAHGPDMRTLLMRCFYAIEEVVPEAIALCDVPNAELPNGYLLRICKTCRGGFLDHLGQWRTECLARKDQPKDEDGEVEVSDPERNIPVRRNGTIRWLTKTEWERLMEGQP